MLGASDGQRSAFTVRWLKNLAYIVVCVSGSADATAFSVFSRLLSVGLWNIKFFFIFDRSLDKHFLLVLMAVKY